MARLAWIGLVIGLWQSSSLGTPFQPWGPRGYRTVNAIEFSPDGETMFVSLFYAEVAKIEGLPVTPEAPEIALFESRRTSTGWSQPRLLPFAGEHKDYEATLSPDGTVMVFNSQRPLPDGTREGDPWMAPDSSYVIFTRWDRAKKWEEDVDLYITFDREGRWTPPVPLSELNVVGTPEYAVSVAGSPAMVYWKARGGTRHAPWAPILDSARARAR